MTSGAQPSFWKRAAVFWFAFEPIRLARWEVIVLRVVIAMLVWDVHTGWINYWDRPHEAVLQMVVSDRQNDLRYSTQPHPNGFGTVVDFSFLANDAVERPLRAATGISLLLYVLGVPAALSLAMPVFFGLGTATLINSQGAIGHIAQGLHLVLLVLWLAGVWCWICWLRRRPLPWGFSAAEFEMDWARQALMSAYVVSAITKLLNSEGGWLASARYFPLHLVKNNDMEYYDTLNPEALRLDWVPQVLMEHPVLCSVFFGLALPLELFAFLGLYNRRMAALFGLGLIGFHETVTQLTHLSFIFNKLLLLFLFVNPLWWIVEGVKKLFQPRPIKAAQQAV